MYLYNNKDVLNLNKLLFVINSNLIQIIDGCQKADRKAQQALYALLASKLMAVCTRFTFSRTEAQDCLQESFIKIFSSIKNYEPSGSFEGWARTITINTTLTYLRKNKKYKFDESIENKDFQFYSTTNSDDKLNEKDILEIINKLPLAYKSVFNLFAIDGYSHAEIANMLEMNESTSRTYLLRAREMLKNLHYKLNYINHEGIAK